MLAAIVFFVKNKMFSGTGLIVTIFAVIFALFLFSNANVILTKFGFETTTTLKSELVQSQGALQNAVAVNTNLNKTLDTTLDHGAKKEQALVESFQEREQVHNTVAAIKQHRADVVKEVTYVLDKETTVSDDVIKIPTAEYNKASETNITSLNDAFDKLFPEGETHA